MSDDRCKGIIMDEPTAALTDEEIQILFRIIAELKAKGISILYISHRMDEIFRISDRLPDSGMENTLRQKQSEKPIMMMWFP